MYPRERIMKVRRSLVEAGRPDGGKIEGKLFEKTRSSTVADGLLHGRQIQSKREQTLVSFDDERSSKVFVKQQPS